MKTKTTALVVASMALAACGVESPSGPQPNLPGLDATTLNAGRRPIGDKPSFTPFTQAPRVINRDEVAQVLEDEYPTLLRQAGVGGRAIIWLRLDETGIVQDTQINQSSGQPALDEAALRVGLAMRFSPAMNRDLVVPVWVSIPVSFQVRQ